MTNDAVLSLPKVVVGGNPPSVNVASTKERPSTPLEKMRTQTKTAMSQLVETIISIHGTLEKKGLPYK